MILEIETRLGALLKSMTSNRDYHSRAKYTSGPIDSCDLCSLALNAMTIEIECTVHETLDNTYNYSLQLL